MQKDLLTPQLSAQQVVLLSMLHFAATASNASLPRPPPPTHTHACQERKAEAEREVERARGAVESGEGGVFVSSVRVTLTWVTCVRVWEPLRAPGSHADQKEVAV